MAVLAVDVVSSVLILLLGAVSDVLGIPRDHIGVVWEVASVFFYCVPVVLVRGAVGGKLRGSRYA